MLDEKTALVEGYTSYYSFCRKRAGYSGEIFHIYAVQMIETYIFYLFKVLLHTVKTHVVPLKQRKA